MTGVSKLCGKQLESSTNELFDKNIETKWLTFATRSDSPERVDFNDDDVITLEYENGVCRFLTGREFLEELKESARRDVVESIGRAYSDLRTDEKKDDEVSGADEETGIFSIPETLPPFGESVELQQSRGWLKNKITWVLKKSRNHHG